MIGFALRWDGQEHGALWISGDTVLYDGVREVASRLDVGVAILHLGAARFPVTGPVHYTMTARNAVELCRLVRPRTVLPVHYEGWSHFRQGRTAIEAEFATAPSDIRSNPSTPADRHASRSRRVSDSSKVGRDVSARVRYCSRSQMVTVVSWNARSSAGTKPSARSVAAARCARSSAN